MPRKIGLYLVLSGLLMGQLFQQAVAEEPAKKVDESELENAEPLPEEADFLKMSSTAWQKQLAEWKADLRVNPKETEEAASEAAAEKIAAIRDPQALAGLEKILLEGEYAVIQVAFLEPFRNIEGKRAVHLLTRAAVEPRSKLMREQAALILAQRADASEAIPALVKYLKGKKFRENALLALMNSELTAPTGGVLPDKQLFGMLVAILLRNDDEIVHEEMFRNLASWRSLGNNPVFDFRAINKDAIDRLKAELDQLEPDPNVHKVLTKYTGHDFAYDQLKWIDWYLNTAKVAKERKEDLPGDEVKPEDKLDPAAVANWHKQIGEWTKQYRVHPQPAEQAASDMVLAQINAIADKAAIPALKKAISGQRYVTVAVIYVEPLAKCGGRDALDFLVKLSVEHKSDTMRTAAATAIAQMPNAADATPQYIRYLRTPQHSVYAARALSLNGLTKYQSGKLPDPQLFQALVNSLVLPDVSWIPVAYWWDSGVQATPTASGSTHGTHYFRSWGVAKGTAKIVRPKPNPIAEACLKEYTGQSYGYDQEAWNQWLQKERKTRDKK